MTTDETLAAAHAHIDGQRRRRVQWPWVAMFIVLLLSGLTIFQLVRQVGELQRKFDQSTMSSTQQIQALAIKVDELQTELTGVRADNQAKDAIIAAKDARNRQLTDELIRRGIPVPRPLVVEPSRSPSTAASPSPSRSPSPSPTRTSPSASPQPKPTVTRSPSPSPSPSPTPSVVCVIVPPLKPICVG